MTWLPPNEVSIHDFVVFMHYIWFVLLLNFVQCIIYALFTAGILLTTLYKVCCAAGIFHYFIYTLFFLLES